MPEITKQRPKFLSLKDIRLPVPGIASILHRISGAGLFLFLPLLVYMLQLSLGTPQDQETFRAVVGNPFVKFILTGLLWAFLHHFCMGIRLLLIDRHIGVDLPTARMSAKLVLAVSLLLTAILGAKLW